MRFLETIGQSVPESRPQNSRPDIAQRLTRDDAAPGIQTAPAPESSRSNRIHAAVVWSAPVIVVAAVAVAAWLGVREFATLVAHDTEASADAPPAVQPHAEKPGPKRRSVRPRAAVRSAAKNENAVDAGVPQARAEIASEASVSTIGPASHVATVRETEAASIETMSDSTAGALVAAPPEDDYVYSSGAGVLAPRLVSLGFVHRLVRGFEVRTSTLELLISKSGTVERAKISSSTSPNWEDALLLSRAKTFQFVPAQRNGFPVRYRFVMEVDATP